MKNLKKICVFIGIISIFGMFGTICKATGSSSDGDELDIAICETSLDLVGVERELRCAEPYVFRIYQSHKSPQVRKDAETWMIDRHFTEFRRYLQLKTRLDDLFFTQHLEIISKIKGVN